MIIKISSGSSVGSRRTAANRLAAACHDDEQETVDLLPALMCGVATGVRDLFQGALLQAAPGARVLPKGETVEEEGDPHQVTIELKVGPIKRAIRIGVKIEEYEKEKDAADFPFSKFVTDVLRAS